MKIDYIESNDAAEAQPDWFCPNTAQSLTIPRLARVNHSIEAFAYCVLGAQVNIRSSILGSGGRAREVQNEFLTLVEEEIIQSDMAASVQRYRLVIDEARVRLNLALCTLWCLPDARKNGDKYSFRVRLQQPTQTS